MWAQVTILNICSGLISTALLAIDWKYRSDVKYMSSSYWPLSKMIEGRSRTVRACMLTAGTANAVAIEQHGKIVSNTLGVSNFVKRHSVTLCSEQNADRAD